MKLMPFVKNLDVVLKKLFKKISYIKTMRRVAATQFGLVMFGRHKSISLLVSLNLGLLSIR